VGGGSDTASEQLLTYVSGLGPQLARNIIALRDESGPCSSSPGRSSEKCPTGPKAFEQAGGFLRIRDGKNPSMPAPSTRGLSIVESMAKDLGCEVKDLLSDEGLRKRIDLNRYSQTLWVADPHGYPPELAKPGRDPRQQFESVGFAERDYEDRRPPARMNLSGVITNVTAFGAFVDIGVHQDGLVHVSELANGL